MSTEIHEKRICSICGAEHYNSDSLNACAKDECYEQAARNEEDEIARTWLRSHAPKKFQDTERTKIPSQSGFKALMDWKHWNGISFAYVFGGTGMGKTRSIYWWLGLHQYNYSEDLDIVVVTGPELKDAIWGATAPNGDKSGPSIFALMKRYQEADVLWIDEADKCEFSPGVEDRFFSIIEYRERHELITILSSPIDLKEFAAKLKRHGDQVIRRIVESGAGIKFSPPPPPPKKLLKVTTIKPSISSEDYEIEIENAHEPKTKKASTR